LLVALVSRSSGVLGRSGDQMRRRDPVRSSDLGTPSNVRFPVSQEGGEEDVRGIAKGCSPNRLYLYCPHAKASSPETPTSNAIQQRFSLATRSGLRIR